MGAYRYVKTTTIVEIIWEDHAGKSHEDVAAIAIYAYKPWGYLGSGQANRELHFQLVQPWINAWKRSKVEPPTLVIIGERDEKTRAIQFPEASAVWRVRAGSFVDDYTEPVGKLMGYTPRLADQVG